MATKRLIDAKFAQHIANVELDYDDAGTVQWVLSHTPTAVWILILTGISELWKFTDVAIYGYSQRSAVDALMAVFLTEWIDRKIWR